MILLNGRRHVPYATGGTVDMNAIAPNTIERIDVLLDGASAVYGSDAIGGVVNIITKDDLMVLQWRAIQADLLRAMETSQI